MSDIPTIGMIGEIVVIESNQYFPEGGYWKVNESSPLAFNLQKVTNLVFRGDHGNGDLTLTAGNWLVSERKNIQNKWCIVAERY